MGNVDGIAGSENGESVGTIEVGSVHGVVVDLGWQTKSVGVQISSYNLTRDSPNHQ